MKLFLKFLLQYKKNAVIFLLFSAIFSVVFFLYQTSVEAVIYASILCIVIAALVVCINFIRFRKKHKLLKTVYENLPLMTENIPADKELLWEDLYNIIKKLSEINTENINHLKNVQQDSIDYFSVWVHQIKTPIAAMNMILQSEDTETNHELLSELFKIEQYAQMALCYIRLDSQTTDYVIGKYDIDKIVKKAIHSYAPLFIRRKIKLEYQPVSGKVLTDEKWLLFIIEQILSNSVKYTPSGFVKISYSNCVLSISDTGIGISSEDLPRVFEKGYTGLSGRTDKKSTGLGLYLCKKIADNLGIKLYVSSEIGKGTKFSIDLNTKSFYIE